jgi:hypothetical protein
MFCTMETIFFFLSIQARLSVLAVAPVASAEGTTTIGKGSSLTTTRQRRPRLHPSQQHSSFLVRNVTCINYSFWLFKGLRYDLRFDLRFGVCVILTTQGNALPACVIERRLSLELAAATQGNALPLMKN